MILFPTQKTTWDKIQKTNKVKNACGRPGINGGMMDDPYARFGVNCFGVKPPPSDDDVEKLAAVAAGNSLAMPQTEEDRILAMKAQYWKEHGSNILKVNAFNNTAWSEL
jgi:hypothetical protein